MFVSVYQLQNRNLYPLQGILLYVPGMLYFINIVFVHTPKIYRTKKNNIHHSSLLFLFSKLKFQIIIHSLTLTQTSNPASYYSNPEKKYFLSIYKSFISKNNSFCVIKNFLKSLRMFCIEVQLNLFTISSTYIQYLFS